MSVRNSFLFLGSPLFIWLIQNALQILQACVCVCIKKDAKYETSWLGKIKMYSPK